LGNRIVRLAFATGVYGVFSPKPLKEELDAFPNLKLATRHSPVVPGNSDLVDTLAVEPHPFLHPSFYVNGHSGSIAGLPSHSRRPSD
jgi:hypothetical protein